MPNKNIFCNSPWYELQIYWDGSLGFCCQESHKIYPDNESAHYNVQNMSIKEWFNSEPMRQARINLLGDTKNSICSRCYFEEQVSNTSRRHRSNQKSVIFTKSNFEESYLQSPGYLKFQESKNNNGKYSGMPIDVHIDLGNYCNLACKMCWPGASSKIANQYVKWGIKDSSAYVGTDWTRDNEVWQRVISELADIKDLRNIHFMGGETLITKRFEDFVDHMISAKRFDLNFSFVTNGTTFNESLINKLKKFQRVGIEVSIETTTEHNSYQRQGTDTQQVLENIDRYLSHCNGDNITLTIRPAISLLTIGYYHTLLRYCLQRQLIVKSLLVTRPTYLDLRILPNNIKQQYKQKYIDLVDEYNLNRVNSQLDYNESDPNQILRVIKNQVDQCLNMLSEPQPTDSDQRLTEMVHWCRQWDNIYDYNATELYPELAQEFVNRGY